MKSANNVNNNTGKDEALEYNDGRSEDRGVIRRITQDWIDMHMKNRENEFTKAAECSIFCGTWNVNAKKQEGGLFDWLLPSSTAERADIYAVGFQEIVDLNAMNVALNSNNTQQRAQFWNEQITECLNNSGFKYRMIAEKYMVGLLLVIYAKESIADQIHDVRTFNLGVGIMGMMGNKGGVSIRCSLFDSTICFVCAHLAAHRENVAGRNSDYKNIYERSVFVSEMSTENQENVIVYNDIIMPRQGAARYFDLAVRIPEHDLIFWMGDLNYRIDDSLKTEEVFQCISNNDLETLRVKDQLNIERSRGRVFHGFTEGVLNFPPTYKYQPGTDVYEQRPEKKLRAPAWCDRVLWKIASENHNNYNGGKEIVRLLDYRRSSLMPSDHKPVSASFQCIVKQVVEDREKSVFKELCKVLEKFSGKSNLSVQLSDLKITMDKVYFDLPQEASIQIKNVGDSIACWRFVPKLEEKKVCKRWISLSKHSGLLLPGESTTITLTVRVDKKTAHLLNTGKDLLQDVIILRVEKSVDYHVHVKAEYERSCFGMSLEDLVQLLEPVSNLPYPAVTPDGFIDAPATAMTVSSSDPNNNTESKLSIPKEVWRIIDALWTGNALKEKDLFNSAYANAAEVRMIREALDRGLDFGPCSPHSLVEALIIFLSSLPRPLLPLDLYPVRELPQDPATKRSACRKFLEDLPALNYNVFVYLLSFLREVLAEEMYNRCSAEQLSTVCVQCMTTAIHDDQEYYDGISREEREKRETRQGYMQQIILYLLTTSAL